jgi:hypothetical protein
MASAMQVACQAHKAVGNLQLLEPQTSGRSHFCAGPPAHLRRTHWVGKKVARFCGRATRRPQHRHTGKSTSFYGYAGMIKTSDDSMVLGTVQQAWFLWEWLAGAR